MDNKLFSVEGKVALVTGAGSGLGERFASVLGEHGAEVVCVARRKEMLEKVANEINDSGGSAIAVSADVSDRASIEAAFDTAEEKYGVVDVVVNCAGIQALESFLDMADEQFTSVMDINVNGLWRVAQIGAERMVRVGKGGSIINIASILGLMARPAASNYCASKAAVLHMTKSMALDLVDKGIRVNTMAPGYFDTDLTSWWLQTEEGQAAKARLPIKRFGNLQELDGPLLLLASDASSYMSGSTLVIDAAHSVKIVE